jgi:carboxylate-amine ligase
MPLPDFHVSTPFTLGIELELQVVNPPGYDLSQDSSRLIDAVKAQVKAGEVKHDITESMLEIATGVCRDINQAAHQFSAMQQIILQAANEHHVQICGGGTHPFQKWQRQEISNDERYHRTLEMFGYLMQQATVFGQHVHVVVRVAMTPSIFFMAYHALCRILSRLAPLPHTCSAPIPVSPHRD